MAPREFRIKFTVDATTARGLRLRLAKVLVALVSVLLKVRIRPEAVYERESVAAETRSHREFLYRGTVGTVDPTRIS